MTEFLSSLSAKPFTKAHISFKCNSIMKEIYYINEAALNFFETNLVIIMKCLNADRSGKEYKVY